MQARKTKVFVVMIVVAEDDIEAEREALYLAKRMYTGIRLEVEEIYVLGMNKQYIKIF